MLTRRTPKIIPPRSRVRLLRADRRTPSWKHDVGRQFRVGYYSRKDGLDCIWLVNENGEYEQTTNRTFLLKYVDLEQVSPEKNYYGSGKRRLRKIHIPSPLERLNARSSVEAYEGAKWIWRRDDPTLVRGVIGVLLRGRRVFNRAAAAYALELSRGNPLSAPWRNRLQTSENIPRSEGRPPNP